jgi:ATP-dependent exoDNAse (exonuclease V) alpha subunit
MAQVTVSENREASAKKLLTEWANDGGTKNPKKSIILTQTRAEAQTINRLCQFERLLASELGRQFVEIGAYKVYENDRIMFHQSLRVKGLENGYRGTVVKIDEANRQCTILLDQKPVPIPGRISGGNEVTLTFDQLNQAKTTLAYSATTHKMQGQTVDQTYVLVGGPMTSQELTYVQATRAREFTKFYLDRAHAGEEFQQIIQEINRSRIKDLAHDQERRIN